MPSADEMDSGDPTTSDGRSSSDGPSPDRTSVLDFNERERMRIGFDLHDGPAQTMSAALLQLKMLDGLEGDELRAGLAELRTLITRTLDETYELIEYLRSRSLDESDLTGKLGAWVREFTSHSGVEASFHSEGPEVPVSPSLQIAVFRIVQEALTNVRRHADADRVDVVLRTTPDLVTCTVCDNGRGFEGSYDDRSNARRRSYGLVSMQERARLLDGECVVTSVPGQGTCIEVRIPVWRG